MIPIIELSHSLPLDDPARAYIDLRRTSREAREAGDRLFFPGTLCMGSRHAAPRRVSDGVCIECVHAAQLKKTRAATAKLNAVRRAKKQAAEAAKAAREAQREEARRVAARKALKAARARVQAFMEVKAAARAETRAANERAASTALEAEKVNMGCVDGTSAPEAEQSAAPWD